MKLSQGRFPSVPVGTSLPIIINAWVIGWGKMAIGGNPHRIAKSWSARVLVERVESLSLENLSLENRIGIGRRSFKRRQSVNLAMFQFYAREMYCHEIRDL